MDLDFSEQETEVFPPAVTVPDIALDLSPAVEASLRRRYGRILSRHFSLRERLHESLSR